VREAEQDGLGGGTSDLPDEQTRCGGGIGVHDRVQARARGSDGGHARACSRSRGGGRRIGERANVHGARHAGGKGLGPGAGPIQFKGIQMNTHYFWQKNFNIYTCI
jgi:hypothetical protein